MNRKTMSHRDFPPSLCLVLNIGCLCCDVVVGTASRRYEAAEWLRQMDNGASSSLSKEPSEEEFCLALRNGLILCNVLNRVNPGAVVKVVDNAVVDNLALQSSEGPAQSAIQYFENMRNFLEAVNDMKLLTFEASDLEKVTMTLTPFTFKDSIFALLFLWG